MSPDPVIGYGTSNVTGEPSPLGSLVRLHDFARVEARLQALEAENDALRAEVQASRDALALTAVELAEVRKERDRAVERLERAGIL